MNRTKVCVSMYHSVNPNSVGYWGWPLRCCPGGLFPSHMTLYWSAGPRTQRQLRGVLLRMCACCRPNQPVCGRGSSSTWWQAVTGLIIRRLNLNPTCYIIHITHYRDIEERSHTHGKEKYQCSIVCYVFGFGSVKCRMYRQSLLFKHWA